MEPELVVRLENWFRLKATNSSMTVPTAKESHPRFPELENIRGTINAAVMVGEISAMFCASSSMKFRQFGLSWFLVFMGVSFQVSRSYLMSGGFGAWGFAGG